MPDFTRVINLAYMRILGRPADAGGLDNYNRLMNSGLTEAQMRESLLRSGEYAGNNPDRAPLATPAGAANASKKRSRKATTRPRASGRKR